jgi:hypothetical protein
MKFDLDTAWKDTRRLWSENRTLLATIAGVFVFIPYAALLIVLPAIAPLPQPPADADFDAIVKAFNAFYAEAWWALALVGITTTLGQLAMLALVERKPGPTVGGAIGIAGKAILPAWLALLIQSLGINFISLAIIAVASMTGLAGLAFLATVAAFVIAVYLTARLSLVLPVMAAEDLFNPFAALRTSWRRTAGHGGRIFAFYALVGLGAIILASVIVMILGLILALLGDAAAETGGMIVSALVVSSMLVLFTLVLAAVHRQTARLGRTKGSE